LVLASFEPTPQGIEKVIRDVTKIPVPKFLLQWGSGIVHKVHYAFRQVVRRELDRASGKPATSRHLASGLLAAVVEQRKEWATVNKVQVLQP